MEREKEHEQLWCVPITLHKSEETSQESCLSVVSRTSEEQRNGDHFFGTDATT